MVYKVYLSNDVKLHQCSGAERLAMEQIMRQCLGKMSHEVRLHVDNSQPQKDFPTVAMSVGPILGSNCVGRFG